MKRTWWIVPILACLPGAHAAAQASWTHSMVVNGPGACKPYSPTAVVRYSASGLRNAGGSSIHVICALPGRMTGQVGGGSYDGVNNQQAVALTNPLGKAVEVTCSFLPGRPTGGGATDSSPTYSNTVTVAARSGRFFSFYYPYTQGMTQYTCLLPPGVEINSASRSYVEQLGEQ